MLLEFRVKNFKAFRDEQVFSLIASSDKTHPENVIELPEIKGIRLLRSAVIYGANASGKTTLMDALNFSTSFISGSAKSDPDEKISVKPFLLDDTSRSKSIDFEYGFIQGGVRYQYGFKVNRKQVLEEWLYSYPKGKARKLFYREEKKDKRNGDYSFSTYLKGEKEKLISLTKSNTLFLSVGATFNNPQLSKVYNWFVEKTEGVQAHRVRDRIFSEDIPDENRMIQIRELLRYADLGIVDFSMSEKGNILRELPEDAPIVKISEVMQDYKEKYPEIDMRSFDVNMLHSVGNKRIPLSLGEESAGTHQIFSLSFPILEALSKGQVIFIDELDNSLHPMLVQAIVRLFNDPLINTKNAQLVFNTHDTTLLKSSFFRRDQIWFVEKDENSASHIYSLSEFSPRKHEAFEKGYLQGKYGSIPFIGEYPVG